MLIYRLENEEGVGVYSRGYAHNSTRAALEGEQVLEYHPGPTEEPKLKDWWNGTKLSKKRQWDWKFHSTSERNLWRCAFASREQLVEWFPKAGLERIKGLADRQQDSMAIVVYEVPHHKTKRGDAQVMYRSDCVSLVERITLADFIAAL